MDVKQTLSMMGLSVNESNAYLELLALGKASIQELTRRLGLPRSTTYHTLEYLASKGLVAKIVEKNVTNYSAADPQKLLDQLREKQQILTTMMPQLKSYVEQRTTPNSVQIFSGFEGIHTIISDVFAVKQQVDYFGGFKKSLDVLKHLPSHARTVRVIKKIPSRIVVDPADDQLFHTKEYQAITDLRFYDGFKDFPAMIFIYGDKVSMFTFKTDLVGIIVQNKDFAMAMRMVFDVYWGISTPAKFKADIKLSAVPGFMN